MRVVARLAWLATLLLASTAAEAAPARLGLTFPPLPFLAPGADVTVDGNLTYSYDAPAGNLTNVTLAPVAGPAWLSARIEPAALQVAADDASGRTVVPVRLTVGVRAGTAALEQHTLQLRLSASANPPLEPVEGTAGVVVRVAFVGKLRVEPAGDRATAFPGDPAQVGLRVVNEGNGPARFTVAPAEPGGAVVVLAPSPVLVEARGALQERLINVSLLGSQPGSHSIPLRYSSTHAFDPTLTGDSGQVVVTLEVKEAGLPAPVAPALALAALAALLLKRRA